MVTQTRASQWLSAHGVETVWIIHLKIRTSQICSGYSLTAIGTPTIAGTSIHVELASLFRSMDEYNKT